MKTALFGALLLLTAPAAIATDMVTVADASLIKWELIPTGVAYFRNLNEFDATFLGCCYNYSIDPTTAAGKSMWSTLLLKMASQRSVSLSVNNKATAGPVLYLGSY